MSGLLEGKVVLITGASSGIGRATALACAREGCKIVTASRSIEAGNETVRRVGEAGGQALFVRTDVTQAKDVEALVARTVESFGRLDCAFNNAGVEGEGIPFIDASEDDWDRVINTNLKGVWLCMKAELRRMLEQRSGVIVNASSVLGHVANRSALYTASKHGVLGLTKSAALAYAQSGIRINAVCPAYIQSPMADRVYNNAPERKAMVIARHPVGRLGTPEEVAAAVIWLCSDAASFITGHALNVDGGYLAQ